MKKIFVTSLIVALSVLTVAPAMAHETSASSKAVVARVQAKYVRRAATVTGTIASLAGTTAPTTLVVNVKNVLPKKAKKWTGAYPVSGQNLTVQISSTTKVVRDYNAKARLSELRAGDSVRIIVKTNEDGTVTAQVLKDESIHASLKTGKVTSIDTVNGSFVLTSGKNNLTVLVNSSTKIIVAKVTSSTLANLVVGNTVKVNGYVNTNTKTVYAAKTVHVIKK